jgi:sporulation protein YlmC with PRC-barrel domain
MLRSLNDLEGYAIRATDGLIGHVQDFYFDDETWVVRYLVVEAATWLSSRKVLISPVAIGQPNWTDKVLPVSITREQVKNSPDIDTDKPVSRQHEMEYFGYYGYYPYYWGGAGLWGGGAYPGAMLTSGGFAGSGAEYLTAQAKLARVAREASQNENDNAHLRSGKAVMKYHIEASDGGIGHVQGLLLDDETWAIRYLIVDTSNWWLGHQVLIAPKWIQHVSWSEHTVSVNLNRESVKDAPPYHSVATLDRGEEISLHKHYKRAGYWADEVRLAR